MPDDKGRGPGPVRGPIGPLGPIRPIRPVPPKPAPPHAADPVTVLRPADLLLLRFSFANLQMAGTGTNRVLTALVPGRPGALIVDFPPQHLIEEAFPEKTDDGDKPMTDVQRDLPEGSPPPAKPLPGLTNDTTPLAIPPVQASLSANSRLVFSVDGETIPWSLNGLLDAMTRLPLRVAPHAENPFHTLEPARDHIIAALTQPAAVTNMTGGVLHAVPAAIRTAARTAAAARLLDQRVGREASAEISSVSRFAAELGILRRPLNPIAVKAKPPEPQPPQRFETAIELPWRLQISPPSTAGFIHTTTPVVHAEHTELWHSRLGHRGTDGVDDSHGATVRAIWTRDKDGPLAPADPNAMGTTDVPGFTKSLTTRDRQKLVDETSNFHLRNGADTADWLPPPVDVDRLMLTTLGGWLSSDFNAPRLPRGDFPITEWKHRATMGRDHEVKVVYAGFLFPFGHAASLIKVTERKISPHPSLPGRYAYLRQRFFIIVRQAMMTYPAAEHSLGWDYGRVMGWDPTQNTGHLDFAMPFSSINVLTRVTPDLDPPKLVVGPGFCFFPSVNGDPFPFKILAGDREGQIVEYSGPLMFMERGHNETTKKLNAVSNAYFAAEPAKRVHRLGGQRVSFAPSMDANKVPLDTTLAVESLEFDAAVLASNSSQDVPGFRPVLRTANVVSPAMNALAGVSKSVTVRYPGAYLANGFAGNATHVFLELVDSEPMSFGQQADRSGGFVSPSLAVSALSGSKGPIGGPIEQAIAGTMTPGDFFAGLDLPAKLFGAIKLSDLLDPLLPDTMPSFVAGSVNQVTGFLDDVRRLSELANQITALSTAKAPALAVLSAAADPAALGGVITALASQLDGLSAAIGNAANTPKPVLIEAGGVVSRLRDYTIPQNAKIGGLVDAVSQFRSGATLPETVNAKLSWSTLLKAGPSGIEIFRPVAAQGSTLDLHVEIQPPAPGKTEPTTTVACSISPFDLRLIGDVPFITLHVDLMEFIVRDGRKPDVNVVLHEKQNDDDVEGVEFGGPLSFVKTLSEIIPFGGFSDPPYIDVDAQGITAGFDLSLPDLSVGILSLCNISLGAKALVPFIGDSLDFTFSFCSRENPFRLTVWLFGGGGFFAVTVTPEGCRMLEASFEFGAAVALDFGVASGSIECMAGIYFKLEMRPEGDDGVLAGYFRLRGEVDVLGLISASIEMYLELRYETATGKAIGKASLSIEVEVLFLSFSVEIECEKKFKGSNADPKFGEVMTPLPWDEYCNAFAAG